MRESQAQQKSSERSAAETSPCVAESKSDSRRGETALGVLKAARSDPFQRSQVTSLDIFEGPFSAIYERNESFAAESRDVGGVHHATNAQIKQAMHERLVISLLHS